MYPSENQINLRLGILLENEKVILLQHKELNQKLNLIEQERLILTELLSFLKKNG